MKIQRWAAARLRRASTELRKDLRYLGKDVIAVGTLELVNAGAIPSFMPISSHARRVRFHDWADSGLEIRIEKEGK